MKKQNGITLLALVITIIVLIILAGVTISALLGDDGIVEQTEIAEEKTNVAGEKEQIEIAYNAVYINNKRNKLGDVTVGQLEQQLKDNGAKIKDNGVSSEIINEGTENEETVFTIVFSSGAQYQIEDGEVKTPETGSTGNVIPEGMYSNSNVVPTDTKYFDFTLDSDTKTATVTGINPEYGEMTAYYNGKYANYYTAIKDGSSYITEIVIPYQVEDENGELYTVTSIGQYAFVSDNQGGYYNIENGITKIELPNTITSIANNAFSEYDELKEIIIPSSVTSIGSSAFAYCLDLESVYFKHTTAPTFGSSCFYKSSGVQTTFYFKNSTVADSLKSNSDVSSGYHYISSYGTKSTDYTWE